MGYRKCEDGLFRNENGELSPNSIAVLARGKSTPKKITNPILRAEPPELLAKDLAIPDDTVLAALQEIEQHGVVQKQSETIGHPTTLKAIVLFLAVVGIASLIVFICFMLRN